MSDSLKQPSPLEDVPSIASDSSPEPAQPMIPGGRAAATSYVREEKPMALNERTAWDEAMLLERKRQARLEAADKAMEALRKDIDDGQYLYTRFGDSAVCPVCHSEECDPDCPYKAWDELRDPVEGD